MIMLTCVKAWEGNVQICPKIDIEGFNGLPPVNVPLVGAHDVVNWDEFKGILHLTGHFIHRLSGE